MRFKNLSYLNRKGPRYIKQRNNIDCGPVSVVNLKKWLGYSATYKDVSKIKESKVFDDEAWVINLLDYLDKLKTKYVEYVSPIHLSEINKNLNKGAGILICIPHKINNEWKSHMSLIIGRQGRKYRIVNHMLNSSLSSIDRKYLAKELKSRNRYNYPIGWIVHKEEKEINASV